MKKNLKLLAIVLITFAVSACGNSQDDRTASTGANPAATPTQPNPPAAAAQLNLHLIKGPVSGASCELLDSVTNEPIATSTTPSKEGLLSITTDKISGEYLVRCSGGGYIDEATGRPYDLDTPLRSLTELKAGSKTVVITPITEIAVRQSAATSGGVTKNFKSKVAAVGQMFGLDSQVDWSTVVPSRTLATARDDNPGRYGAVLATLSQLQENKRQQSNNSNTDLSDILGEINSGITGGQLNPEVRVAISEAVATAKDRGIISKDTADGIKNDIEKLFSIAGSVSGLAYGETLILQYNNANDLSVSVNGPFRFSQQVNVGTEYTVTIKQAPARLNCLVENASGHATRDVSNVKVSCSGPPMMYRLGGTLSGLAAGTTITLVNNAGNEIRLSSNGEFSFAGTLLHGSAYAVSIVTQPQYQTCSISNGSGIISSDISNIDVSCAPTQVSVGGSLRGLGSGETLVLQNNGGNDLSLQSNGIFRFAQTINAGTEYSVNISQAPARLQCSVSNASGSTASDISNIRVSCRVKTYSLGGSLSGMNSGASLVLQLNGASDLTLNANGPFSFPNALEHGSSYAVAVTRQPQNQTCSISNGSGNISANLSNIAIRCDQTLLTIGGSISGLSSGDEVTLQYNGGNDLTLSENGSFTFTQGLAAGSDYTVSVLRSSSALNCTLSNASGRASSNVSNVQITCSRTATYTLGGTLSGLAAGKTVTLQNNGANDLTLNTNEQFTFDGRLGQGSSYSVTIASQPENQFCRISNNSGSISSNVSNVNVSCSSPTNPIKQIDVVQVYSQVSASTYQLLVPGRSAMVRAYVYDTPETDFSSVSLSINNAAPVSMDCPAGFPDIATAPATPLHQYANSTACVATLSAAQVAAGLSLKVTASNFSKTIAPAINTKSTLKLVLVPLRIKESGQAGAAYISARLTDLADLEAEIIKRFPMRDIDLSVRDSHTVDFTNLTRLPGDGNDWGTLLQQINTLRNAEAADSFYYGYIPTPDSFRGGIAGLGYVPGQAAIGWDSGLDALTGGRVPLSLLTLLHEFGHNMSLGHAPCTTSGNSFPDGIDNFWYSNPWPNADEAKLNSTAIYDGARFIDPTLSGFLNRPAQVGNPATGLRQGEEIGTDIMAYCSGAWLSDYNYHKAATHLRNNVAEAAYISPSAASRLTLAQTNILRISGVLDQSNQVKLNPVNASAAFPPSISSGDYELRLTTRSGEQIRHYFQALAVGDAPEPVWHFAVNLPDPGPLQSIQVFYRGEALSISAPQAASSTSTVAANRLGANSDLNWSESNGELSLRWDPLRFPWLQITHIADNGARLMLASNASGGSLALPTTGLPAGGQWEIVQSDGLNTQRQLLTR